jgi:hypothetical protein
MKPQPDGEMLLTAHDLTQGLRIEFEPPRPAGFTLEQPLPDATVQASIATVQENVQSRNHEVVEAGQVRTAYRVWIWHETRMKSMWFDAGPFSSGRAWIFTGTPASQRRMTIYCHVLYDRGATLEAMKQKTERAGAVFAGVVQRLTVEPAEPVEHSVIPPSPARIVSHALKSATVAWTVYCGLEVFAAVAQLAQFYARTRSPIVVPLFVGPGIWVILWAFPFAVAKNIRRDLRTHSGPAIPSQLVKKETRLGYVLGAAVWIVLVVLTGMLRGAMARNL